MDTLININESPLSVHKQDMRLVPDPRRVITRQFLFWSDGRSRVIIDRVLALDEADVKRLCSEFLRDYSHRHKDLRSILRRHYDEIKRNIPEDASLSEDRRMLIGAYFTMEYAVESAALFNPSIVADPDQSGLGPDQLRIIMSLRAVGEGHISSIEFRRGIVNGYGHVDLEPVSRYVATPQIHKDRLYDKHLFRMKVDVMGAPTPLPEGYGSRSHMGSEVLDGVLGQLDDQFTFDQLTEAIHEYQTLDHGYRAYVDLISERMVLLARSNYAIMFPEDSDVSERVIFPVSHTEHQGIEDARFVRFEDDDGSFHYLATYTAYDGHNVLTHVLETDDFLRFRVHTLNGRVSNSKGMAFFPKRIKGKYAMISRFDGENLYIMYSDNTHFWDEAELLRTPIHPWEFTQIGNCGSPLETDAGWILITHGVGAMRRYCIGALLLDKDDPSQVIGALRRPLLVPEEEEREGYVPNVVYTCGALIHQGNLILPFAVSDSQVRMATVPLDELLAALTES